MALIFCAGGFIFTAAIVYRGAECTSMGILVRADLALDVPRGMPLDDVQGLDADDHLRGPDGNSQSQDQIIVIGLAPCLIGIVAAERNLLAKVLHLAKQQLGMWHGLADAQDVILEHDLRYRYQVALGHVVRLVGITRLTCPPPVIEIATGESAAIISTGPAPTPVLSTAK